jgi:glycerophosphoryl diester phosphodiesterase
LAALSAALLSAAATANTPDAADRVSLQTRVIALAHCSCRGPAPENSIAAINHCKVIGADAVEMDARESRDGVLVVVHDETVDRTTNGTGLVAEKTAAELRALRLKIATGGPEAAFTDEHLPTAEEALAGVRANGLMVNLHLKVTAQAKTAELVRRMGLVGRATTWVYGKPDDQKLVGRFVSFRRSTSAA